MTSLATPAVRRRFLAILWLSVALHALMIGLTRLPQMSADAVAPEIQVRLEQPKAALPPAPATAEHNPSQIPRPANKAPLPIPQPQAVRQAAPESIVPTAAPHVQVAQLSERSPATPAAGRESPGVELAVPQIVDTRYYTARELDMQPAALRKPDPEYPPQAEDQGVAGRVVIRLHLEADGSVSKTELVSASPAGVFGELFKKATLDSVSGIRFRPAQRNGQPVRAVVEIPVVFEPEP